MDHKQPANELAPSQEDTYLPPVVIRNGLRLIEEDVILPIPAFVTKSISDDAFIMKLRAISDLTRANRLKNKQS